MKTSCAPATAAWSGAARQSVAGRRHPDLGGAAARLDSPGQMVASILSKKIAAGSTHLVIDIPVGPTAKVRHGAGGEAAAQAVRVRRRPFRHAVDVITTDGRQPIGNGIGPVLEARDVMAGAAPTTPPRPADLREKSLRLAGALIDFDPDVRGGDG